MRLRPNVRTSLLVVACVLGLAACAGPQATNIRSLPERVELTGVPAFRGDTYQGGPATLASMLSQQGIVITPGLLEKPLHLPQAQADLERNMQGLAREYGMLVYPLEAKLPALLAQVAAGYPVMVRITEGSTLWAEPRYAVLVGFNQRKNTLLLRVGRERRRLMEFGDFESAWKDAGQWAVLIQRPNQLPADVDPQKWQQAADATARAGQERAAAQALKVMADKTAKP
ncbi:peptidase C39 family protein [Pseudomonas mucidolens]|uniref:peptidase C39 family protein n=1 Tax=Pseudomonas mucidolens TaxID=46679 RepID=UPI0030D897B6